MKRYWPLAPLFSVFLVGSIAFAAKPAWDQVKNVKESAERLGVLHRKSGANGVLKFLDACYRTHTLSSKYTSAVEGCVAQDVMYSRVLSAVYSRVPPEVRVERSLPTAEQIGGALQARVSVVVRQYALLPADMDMLQKLIDDHAMPIVLKVAFPNAGAAPSSAQPGAKK